MFRRLKNLIAVAGLPLSLVLLFAAQNRVFNLWLNIQAHEYVLEQAIVTAALGTLLFGPAVLLGKRWKLAYLSVISLVVSLIFVSQYLYFSYSGGFLQASSLMYSKEALYITGTIKTLLAWRLVFFATGPLSVLAVFFVTRKRLAEAKLSLWGKAGALAAIILISGSGYAYLESAESKEIVNTVNLFSSGKLYSIDTMVARTGVVNYFLEDMMHFASTRHKATPEEKKFVADWNAKRPLPAPADKTFGLARGRNLILIQVESLENILIGKKIGEQEITPHLNQLAKDGMYFDNYYSMIGPGNTADAEFETLNSLYALPDEVAFVGHAYDDYQALPALLKQNGYGTYALHGDVPSFWNRANIYPRLGYDNVLSRNDFSIKPSVCFEDLCDDDFLQQAADKMKSFPQPFMATVITLSSHTPFELPDNLKTLDIPQDMQLTWQQRGYLESIHYADAALGAFVDRLKQSGLYDNSLMLIYGDHQSYTDIAAVLDHDQPAFLSELQKNQVPLIVLAPQMDLHGVNTTPASHLDLYPTVSSLLGIAAPHSVLGQDMLAARDPVVVQRELATGNIHSIQTPTLVYESSADGVYGQGTCLNAATTKELPTGICSAVFKQENDAVSVSDLVVKNNLVSLLSARVTQVSVNR